METSLRLSTHAVEKHLYSHDASVFFNRYLMNTSVKQCLSIPDTVTICGKITEVTKRFNFDIGLLGFTKRPSQNVKVVYKRTKKITFVITAYPIK